MHTRCQDKSLNDLTAATAAAAAAAAAESRKSLANRTKSKQHFCHSPLHTLYKCVNQ